MRMIFLGGWDGFGVGFVVVLVDLLVAVAVGVSASVDSASVIVVLLISTSCPAPASNVSLFFFLSRFAFLRSTLFRFSRSARVSATGTTLTLELTPGTKMVPQAAQDLVWISS
ncbi:MAG: hypothetical protein J3R72DRAFT_440198 [Linnemannia gamsii]|nr:MAG: hypothetical protein J3R72DRAFT_440198 [Linnemannia gamsii]